MVRWWAAFFICGLAAPAGNGDVGRAALVLGALATLAARRPGATAPGARGLGRSDRRTGALATFAVTCAAGIILWSAAGLERSGHGAGAALPASGSSSRLRSLSLWGPRAALLGTLDDGRLSRRARGIVGALILDDRSGLDFDLSETYSYVGITHFLALSGLHLAAIAIPLAWVFSRVLRSRRSSDTALFASLCLYSAVAGFPASLLRSLFLSAAVIAYRLLGLHTDLLGALIAGSFTLAAIDPPVVFDAGFQLSFAAVSAIALIGIPLSRIVEARLPGGFAGKAVKALVFPALITCSVQFMTLPLVISLFKRSSLLSPLVNVIVSVPFTVLLYAGVLYVFVPLALPRALLAPAVNLVCRFLAWAPTVFSRRPHAALYRGDFSIPIYLSAAVCAAWALRGTCPRKRFAAAAGAVLVCVSFLAHAPAPVERVVAHAPATRIRSGSAGRCETVFDPAGGGILFIGDRFGSGEAYRLTRMLWGRGVRRVACCVVQPSKLRRGTGLVYLLSRVRIDEVVCTPYLLTGNEALRELLAGGGCRVREASAGDTIQAGSRRLEICGPEYPPRPGERIPKGSADLRWRLITPQAGREGPR